MTARLVVLALAIVALATQPFAFDLLGLKRALFLATTSLLLLLPAMQRAFVRTIGGATGRFVLTAGAFGLAAAAAIGMRPLSGGGKVVVLRAVLELMLFALAVVLVREVAWERAATLGRGILAIGAAAAAIAILQVAGVDLIYGDASPHVAVATFGNSNAFAAFAAPCLAFGFARASGDRRGLLACGATLLLGAALVVARARGGWLAGAVGVAIAVAGCLRARRSFRRPAIALGLGVLLGVGVDLSTATGGENASKPLGFGLERSSNRIRLDVARATLDLVAEHPVAGVGPGRFRDEYPLVRREREARTPTREGAASEVDHPHDELLRLLAEGGAFTALLALFAVLGAARSLLASEQSARDDDGRLRAAFAAAGAAWLAASLTWSTLYDPSTALLGAVIAGGALAGDVEMTIARPRERPLALLFAAGLVAAALFLAVPTLRAEWIEWNGARDGTLDARDLAAIEEAAAIDDCNVERQYAVAMKLLQAARLDPSGAERRLAAARARLHRALELVPNHVASLDALAEVEARSGDEKAARAALDRLHALEPWRGPAAVRLAELLAGGGHELAAARSRLDAEGDAAVAPLFEQARALRAGGRNRPAAQVLDLIAPRAPEDGDLWRELALALHDLGDDAGYRRAYRQSQIAYALAALAGNRSEDARGNLDVARKYAPAEGATLEALLESCVDLQRGRLDEARARLATLEPEAALTAAQTASPTAARFLGMLARNPALQSEAERLGLDRLGRRGN